MKHPRHAPLWRQALTAAGVLGCGVIGWADPPYVTQGPFVNPVPGGTGIPTPKEVPGKEFTTYPNKDYVHNIDPGQTMRWDGAGGVDEGTDFTVIEHVDALANVSDVLFEALWNNSAHLVYSVKADGVSANRERLWVERWNQAAPAVNAVWARTSDINHDIEDLNGIELWGPEGASDTTHYSLVGDPLLAGQPMAYSVYDASGVGFISQAALAAAVGIPGEAVDLDAMMLYGDRIIFSIAPIANYDGGEIFTWDSALGGPAAFLNHGGHLWDTAFDVCAHTLNCVGTQNVDAIEAIAVPEPAAWAGIAGLLCLGGGLVARLRRNT